MTTVVDLEIPAARLGLDDAFDRVPELECQLTATIGCSPPPAYVSGPEREAVESALSADESVDLLARYDTGVDEPWLYRLDFGREFEVFQHLVARNHGVVLEAAGCDRRWSVTVLFHDREPVSDCHAALEEYGYRAEVTRVSGMHDAVEGRTPLTEIQYETILKAYELGYFEVPRSVTLEELASELDVSHQALSERLRRSHAALVSAELSSRLSRIAIEA